jgi:hypothetical protein
MTGKFRYAQRFPFHFLPCAFDRIEVHEDRVISIRGSKRDIQPINETSRWSVTGSLLFGHSLVLDAKTQESPTGFKESVYTYVFNFPEFRNAIERATGKGCYGG